MAKINVVAEYHWECSKCNHENAIAWQPEIGKKLPACFACETRDTCGGITELTRPAPCFRKSSKA